MALKHAYTATGTNDGAKQVSVDRWNADHAFDMEGVVIPLHTSTPSTPAADNVKLFCKELANRAMPAFIGPSGVDVTLQPHFGRQCIMSAKPKNSNTGLDQIGVALTAVGTATAASVATTSLHTQMTRLDYLVTTASTSAVAGFRTGQTNTFHRGASAGSGGFHMIARVAPATGGTVSTRRFFCGMSGTGGGSAPTDVQPSTLTNIVGVGYDAADTNWQLFFNDGTGTATKVSTGIARPSTDRPSPVEISVFCAPNGGTMYAEIVDLATGTHFMGSEGTDIPGTTTLLSPRGYASVGGTSSVVGFTLFSLYVESDN
jgi:hypothetical protein